MLRQKTKEINERKGKLITETSEPGAREEAIIEDSESQILAVPLERESVDSISLISTTKADCEMKEGKIREASWQRETKCCGSAAVVHGGVAAASLGIDDDDDKLNCFLLLLL